MQPFHKESNWTEKKRSTQDQSIVVQIKERILRVLSENEQDITEEDKYELESCHTLEFESVSNWILRNKTDFYDSALLVRIRKEGDFKFPITVSLMFIHDNQVCLGKEHSKKIIHCAYLSEELDEMFEGKDSLIIK